MNKHPAEKITENHAKRRARFLYIANTFFALLVLAGALFFFYVRSFKIIKEPAALTTEEQNTLEAALDSAFHERLKHIHPLPYSVIPAKIPVSAKNAILVDAATGSVLFEKNADEKVPPASMTKLVVMYIVFKEIERGRISLSDVVPLPPESWARNLPPDASRMFLDQGQTVTLEDLMTGLAVSSGNDAAVAVASYISGGVKAFTDRMNEEVLELGLLNTHFEEPSGYSEKNITTAREFASFSRVYIERFPESLEKFHSKKEFVFPLEKNLPSWQTANAEKLAVAQYNTNKLLWYLDGCDGLKTGFIYESGYNLALTAKRGQTRFLSVTMNGAGNGTAEGNGNRIKDGATLMEWAFSSFADYFNSEALRYTVAVPGGKLKFVNLVPAIDGSALTVPFITGSSPQEAAAKVTVRAELPPYILFQTRAGQIHGKLVYSLEGKDLQTIPLVCDRTVKKAFFPFDIFGKFASLFL
ncbi:D-alanyl-D-alanine carboxypeptidase [Treponema parvum]|uniref:serine-type D-Ala-D-Ala carboxypeptidase n=1 Tax=Treponema parvum TaxID=138851 RepID=A0A975F1A3_9SPIR|nr:D-alanyl-D-alanine carboxypeptidase family protein [Treponema parvum]QTQ12249.1 D-alanyl-D-alanine carboxypeptidase [Treponema parvum]